MKVIVNSLILTIINISSILIGFYVYYLVKASNQIAVQAPVACFVSVMSFLLWKFISWRFIKKLDLKEKEEYIVVFFLSMLFSPIIFVPLHYVTQGYLTSPQNIIGIWLFQLPTNILVLTVYSKFSALLNYKNEAV